MEYGVVCTPGLRTDPSDVGRQADLLRRLKATTARISMYFDSPGFARRYTDSDLDRLRDVGLGEMIIQSSETPTPDQAFDQLEAVRGYIRANPDILFVFEVGNEPDLSGDEVHQPDLARARRLTYLRDRWPLQSEPNLRVAVNMLSQEADNAAYFNDFVRDHGDGLGALLTGPHHPDVVTVHAYHADRLCQNQAARDQNPYKMLDWVRGWTTSLPIKVTECGIGTTHLGNTGPASRAWRYVEFAETVGPNTLEQVDSVCFYSLPKAEALYAIDEAFADEIGARRRTFLCPLRGGQR